MLSLTKSSREETSLLPYGHLVFACLSHPQRKMLPCALMGSSKASFGMLQRRCRGLAELGGLLRLPGSFSGPHQECTHACGMWSQGISLHAEWEAVLCFLWVQFSFSEALFNCVGWPPCRWSHTVKSPVLKIKQSGKMAKNKFNVVVCSQLPNRETISGGRWDGVLILWEAVKSLRCLCEYFCASFYPLTFYCYRTFSHTGFIQARSWQPSIL